jgi:uncharacterized membrane protein
MPTIEVKRNGQKESMIYYLDQILNLLKNLFQIMGVIFITYKAFHAIYIYVKSYNQKGSSNHLRFYILKFDLGRGIILGLELIVVGDLISTIMNQDLQHLIGLTLLVIIRTTINFFLEKDLQTIPEKDRIAIQNM